MTPSDVLVVKRLVGEAPVEDADQSVAERPEGRVVSVPSSAVAVVEGSCPW